MRAITTILALWAACRCAAQVVASAGCPPGTIAAPAVVRACADRLPSDGLVWFRSADGEPCSCMCDTILDGTVDALNALRRAKGMSYAGAIRRHLLAEEAPLRPNGVPQSVPLSWTSSCSVPPDSIRVSGVTDSAFYRTFDHACPSVQRLVGIIERIADLPTLNTAAAEMFVFEVFDEGFRCQEYVFPMKEVSDQCPMIRYSYDMLTHEAMEDELLVLLTLHEMGHAIMDTHIEREADHWAANVGMALYYEGSAFPTALQEATIGMDAYYQAVFKEDQYTKANAEEEGIGAYAELACRISHIEAVLDGGGTGPYAPDCWDDVAEFDVDLFPCDKECPARESLPETIFNKWDALLRQIKQEMKFYALLGGRRDICRTQPWLCRLDPDRLSDLLRDDVSRFATREKRITKHLERTLVELRALRQGMSTVRPSP